MTVLLTLLFFPLVSSSLEKEMVIHSSILASSIPAMGRGAWLATVHGVTRVGHDLVTKPAPLFFILLSFAWFYIFFSTGQVLLSTLSWCSAWTSVSECVFLMYLWKEMYSMSTYSSAILFLCVVYIWSLDLMHVIEGIFFFFLTFYQLLSTQQHDPWLFCIRFHLWVILYSICLSLSPCFT